MATSNHPKKDDGTALVEFALVAPLLIVLLFAMLHFGRAFNYWIDETHLANQGARWVVVNKQLTALDPATCQTGGGGTDDSLRTYLRCQAVTDELRSGQSDPSIPGPDDPATPGPDPMNVFICFPGLAEGTAPKVGDPVRVIVSTTWNWTEFIPLVETLVETSGLDPTTLIETQATMRLEAVPTKYLGDPEVLPTCPTA